MHSYRRATPKQRTMTESKEFKENQDRITDLRSDTSDGNGSELTSGSVFVGRYKILHLIGEGGMGSVYKALDLTLNRQVALKLLHRELVPNERALLRFQQEARATSRIKHAGVVAVYDFGLNEDRRPYLIMDYVQGISLAGLIASPEKLDLERCASIFSKVADALAHTHSKGVVHRDLKPSNILIIGDVPGEESIRVVDFGIATFLDTEEKMDIQNLSHSGDLFGSPLYMSPEQCSGQYTIQWCYYI
jgi:eukaryotic-like serine/threonine-protein kinase